MGDPLIAYLRDMNKSCHAIAKIDKGAIVLEALNNTLCHKTDLYV